MRKSHGSKLSYASQGSIRNSGVGQKIAEIVKKKFEGNKYINVN